jgi:hypothetical protein
LSELETMVRGATDVREGHVDGQRANGPGDTPSNGSYNGHANGHVLHAPAAENGQNGAHSPLPSTNGHNGKPVEDEAPPQEMGLYGMTPTGLSRRLGRRS